MFDAETGEKTGGAEWRNTRRLSANWTFFPSAIGNPGSYGWRVEIVTKSGARIDSVRDSGYREHHL